MFSPSILSLYFIAGSQDCRHMSGNQAQNLLSLLEKTLQSGISCFQFREKGRGALCDEAAIRLLAEECRSLCRQYSVPFVMNNDVELAMRVGADGIHVGQKDMPVAEVRKLCGNKMFIGLSVGNMAEVSAGLDTDSDYFGIGPIFATQSKDDAAAATGCGLIENIRKAGICKPLVAIGGIDAHNAGAVRAAGADGIAVISALTRASDVKAAVRQLLAK